MWLLICLFLCGVALVIVFALGVLLIGVRLVVGIWLPSVAWGVLYY